MSIRRGAWAMAGIAVVVGGTVLASSAIGGGTIQTDLGSVNGLHYQMGKRDYGAIPVGQTGGGYGLCEKGEAAIGAGLLIEGQPNEAYATGTHPNALSSPKPNNWRGEGHNISGPAKDIFGYTVCRKAGAGGVKYRYEEDPLPGFESKTVKVDCPDDTAVVGGGGQASIQLSTQDPWINSTAPFDDGDDGGVPDDGWKVRYHGYTGDEALLGTYAVCLEAGAGQITYSQKTVEDVPKHESAVIFLQCKSGGSVTGAGVEVSRKRHAAFVNSVYPGDNAADDDLVPDDRIIAQAYNRAGPDKDVTAHAICKG